MPSMKTRINLFTRIFLYSIGIVLITLLIGYFFNMFFLDKFYIYRKETTMKEIAEKAEIYHASGKIESLEELIEQASELEGIEVQIKRTGSMGMMMMHKNYPMFKSSELTDKKFNITRIPGIGSLVLSYSVKLPDNDWLLMTTSLSVMNAHKHEINLFNFLTAFVSILVTLAAGAFFSKKITKDIKLLSLEAEEIANLKFPKNIEIDRSDEIGDLSRSIEKMSKELASSINNLKSFVSNASHELKTPISVLCTHAQALSRGQISNEAEKKKYYDIILKTGLEMKELTQNLLILSKLDNPEYRIKKEKIDLKEFLNQSLEKYDFLEFEKDIEVAVNIKSDSIMADPRLLKLALDNIILNALKYSPEGKTVEIYEKNENLYIENQTEEKNLENTEKLLEPFSRGKNAEDSGIEGTGLGLSIVKKSLELNGNSFQILWKDSKFIFIIQI